MITSPTWAGKRYAVLGLARSGAASVRALLAAGASVVAWDSDEAKRTHFLLGTERGTASIQRAVEEQPRATSLEAAPPSFAKGADGLPPRSGEDLGIADLDLLDLAQFDALVVSPGVPLNRHPIAARARAAGMPIIGDIELFAQARASLPPHKVVGVTGTNGKSTTVSLIYHILQTAGIPARLGGNIGLPILEQEPLPEGGVYVLELSSYQIDLTQTLDCDVAVLLNVTPDHLDRYDGFEAYRDAKLRLLDMQAANHLAIVASADNGVGEAVMGMTGGAVLTQWFYGDYAADFAREQRRWPALQGPHNAQNAWAARMTSLGLDVSRGRIDKGLRTFTGLRHRMERVRVAGGVAYVNDSKATNPDSTAPALAAFERIHWILGGQAKTDDLDACAPHFGHIARAYTIGEAAAKFAALLEGKVPVERSGTLDVAVTSAVANARAGDTVLLSPACASFDQFRDFEDRGDQFRRLVEAL